MNSTKQSKNPNDSKKKPIEWEKVTLNPHKLSVAYIGANTDELVRVPIYAPLGSRAMTHYPTHFISMDYFLSVKDEFGLEIAIDDEMERNHFIKQFTHMETTYAIYKEKVDWIRTALKRIIPKKEEEPTDRTK